MIKLTSKLRISVGIGEQKFSERFFLISIPNLILILLTTHLIIHSDTKIIELLYLCMYVLLFSFLNQKINP